MMMFLFYCESKVPYINPTWGELGIGRRYFSCGLIKLCRVTKSMLQNLRNVQKIKRFKKDVKKPNIYDPTTISNESKQMTETQKVD